jgi:NAD+ synthase (glutamine-hydrolysing)
MHAAAVAPTDQTRIQEGHLAMTIVPFNSPYEHGFVRAAVATPRVRVADPGHNVRQVVELAQAAAEDHASLVVFPELALSGYSNEDLFFQDAVLDGVLSALGELAQRSRELESILVVGAPLRVAHALFNCAVILHRGQLRGVVPKSYLPNYREFYEKRHFAPARAAQQRTVHFESVDVPFGADLIFSSPRINMALHVEICEDLWVPIPPSTEAALAGANVLVNLSASNVTIGKPEYRRLLCAAQSAKCVAAYLYSGAGPGESTTDLAWDGHALIYENGDLLQEGERYPSASRIISADIDLDRLRQERMRLTSFGDCADAHRARLASVRHIALDAVPPTSEMPLRRIIDRFPYVPSDPETRSERCLETYNIQVQGLAKRLEATGIKRAVIGVSGGVDSAQALLVTTRAFDRLSLPRGNVLAVTMPGFATSVETRQAAWDLMQALGVRASEIDIRPSAQQMLRDLNHPFAQGEPVYDITFENVQAGERTSHLFRLANMHGGLVVGTGDLSELALGYTTYGVGDHMSHYNVNASVPKTLIRHLIRWATQTHEFDDKTCLALQTILAATISPELIPYSIPGAVQSAEAEVGPYALQDFHLYYLSRFGFRPSKVAYMAWNAWRDPSIGSWPETIPAAERVAYDLPVIARWLELFLVRFFRTSQFKRSAMPNGPKVGSGGSLSPRSDWRAPSDADAQAWMDELRCRLAATR